MPATSKTYTTDTFSKDFIAIDELHAKEIDERSRTFTRGWKYYDGDHDHQLMKQKDNRDDNVVLNEVGVLVNKITSFLIGDGIDFRILASEFGATPSKLSDDDGSPNPSMSDETNNIVTVSSDEDTEQEEKLSDDEISVIEIMRANRDLIMLFNLAIIGSVEGQCTVRIAPPEDEPEDPDMDYRMENQKLPKIRPIKGEHFSAFWDPFDMEQVKWYRLQHIEGGYGKRIDYVKGKPLDELGTVWDHTAPVWTEVEYMADSTHSMVSDGPLSAPILKSMKWQLVENTLKEWPYPWSPIVTWQNLPDPNSFYGKSDIKVAISLNDNINFLMSNALRIVKHYGSPRTVLIGATADDVDQEIGGLISIPKAKDKVNVFNLEMHGDLGTALTLYDVLRFSLWQSGGMVDPRAVKDTVGHLSNFGLRVMFLDGVKTTDKKHLLYEEGLKKVIGRGMMLMGRKDPGARLDIVWSDVLPIDSAKQAETLLAELEARAISMRTYRTKRGWDHFKEEKRLESESEQAGISTGEQILNAVMAQRTAGGDQPSQDASENIDNSEEGTM